MESPAQHGRDGASNAEKTLGLTGSQNTGNITPTAQDIHGIWSPNEGRGVSMHLYVIEENKEGWSLSVD